MLQTQLRYITLLLIISTFIAHPISAATQYHRVMWDADPASRAIIAFSPAGNTSNPYVKYGYSTNEGQWNSAGVADSAQFDGALVSHFVRLTNLPANSAIYYRVCDDQSGCGQRFWFKTAPTDNTPFIVVAGGDTRTGWDTRRQGNQLIAKLRPLFIMHGGDFTNANSASEMQTFLSDWALTYSNDTIDGYDYQRIYPLVPTHGNHEDDNYRTLCEVFGVDYDQNGSCGYTDTYGAFNVSPLLRVYTLNSQFKNSGWSSYAANMNSWLSHDLTANGSTAVWRFAQYHKPMFPHYTFKSDNVELFNWWATEFYNHSMNVVVESDTHIAKLTTTVKPNGNDFIDTIEGGTVYIGEGSWGAPARSANDPKAWTLDLASIQQFKVITVSSDTVELRTAQFDPSASTLSRQDRANDPIALPAGVNWWNAYGVGETMILTQNSAGRSLLGTGDSNVSDHLSLAASEDTFISSTQSNNNFNGSAEGLLADEFDVTYGEMVTLIKFDLSAVPTCARIETAAIELDVSNPSNGTYNVYAGNSAWSATTVTWDTVNGTHQQGTQIGTFSPSAKGLKSIRLTQTGLDIVRNWHQMGSNNGVVIASDGSLDGVDMYSTEMGRGPLLKVGFDSSDCVANTALNKGIAKTNLTTAAVGEQLAFTFDVPANATDLSFTLSSGSGDADLYVKFGSAPTTANYDCRPWLSGNNETCRFDTPIQGTYYVMLDAYQPFTGVSLMADYQIGGAQAPVSVTLNALEDTFISSNRSGSNYDNDDDGLLADGSDLFYGTLMALVKFDLSTVPSCANVTQATLRLQVTNVAYDAYKVHAGVNHWAAGTATWQSVGGTNQKGTEMAAFTPSAKGAQIISFEQAGLTVINGWLQGANQGIVIASGGTSNGLDFKSSELGDGPVLELTYLTNSCQ